MELANAIQVFYKLAKEDSNISPSHLAIYNALLFIWSEQKQMPIFITRKIIMYLAHIRGKATYQKCIRDLNNYHYLIYKPSFDPAGKSLIYLNLGSELLQ